MRQSADLVDQGLLDLTIVDENLNKKVLDLEKAAEEWTIGEKMGTPNALRVILKKAKQIRDRALRTQKKLTATLTKIEDFGLSDE